jgi:hypothetical protein
MNPSQMVPRRPGPKKPHWVDRFVPIPFTAHPEAAESDNEKGIAPDFVMMGTFKITSRFWRLMLSTEWVS